MGYGGEDKKKRHLKSVFLVKLTESIQSVFWESMRRILRELKHFTLLKTAII